jgi:Zn-dependent protease
MLFGGDPISTIVNFVALVFSLSIHEWAHAQSALWLGDDTAKLQGRCTPNPLPHLDIIGTVLLPLMGVPFGWAKPVPVNPLRFNRRWSPRQGMMITACAGPVSNVMLAFVAGAALWAAAQVPMLEMLLTRTGQRILLTMVVVNFILAFFNLFPVPPLDGSRVADYFMPRAWRPMWERVYYAGPWALMILIIALQFGGGGLLMPAYIAAGMVLRLFGIHVVY